MDAALAIGRRVPAAMVGGLGALGVMIGLLALRDATVQMPSAAPAPETQVAQLPLSFEPNAGRADRAVDYIAHSVSGGTLYLSGREATLALGERALRLTFAGAAPDPRVVGLDRLPGEANSFIGDDPSGWRTHLPTYAAVRYRGLYPGIDADFYGSQRSLEYDFRLAPRADPSRIAIDLAGADSIELAPSGDLEMMLGKREIIQRAPVAYQWINGTRAPVESSYLLSGSRVGINLGPYDRSRPLVIDPTIVYSTYLGGAGADAAFGLAVDSSGAAYVTGATDSADFPTQGPFQGDQPGGDAFVSKLNPAGTALEYSTYLGGGTGAFPNDQGNGIAVDSSGAAYVSGSTNSSDFPTLDPLQGNQNGLDAFLTKLAPTGAALDYSTYLGGDSSDGANAVAIDSGGGAYIAGTTLSNDFPTPDAFQDTKGGTGDAFVARFNPHIGPGAVTLGYSTYLGGAGSGFVESAAGIAVDSSGAAYVTGATDTTDFPTTPGPLQGNQPGHDGFVTKLSPDSAADETLVYSTYLGGNGLDPDSSGRDLEEGLAIAVDSGGSAYVTGRTNSTDFPTQGPFQGNQPLEDAFVTKLNPAGTGLAYSTYLGGSLNDWGYGIDVNTAGEAYVTGITGSGDFPQQDPIQPDAATDDVFVTLLNSGGNTLGYSTLFGGDGIDWGRGIAVGPSGDAYVAGFTASTDLPIGRADGDRLPNGNQAGDDAWVGRFGRGSSGTPGTPCAGAKVYKDVSDDWLSKSRPTYSTDLDTHQNSFLEFRVYIDAPPDCRWTLRETQQSQEAFEIFEPYPTTDIYGYQVVYFHAFANHDGELVNTVELVLQDGRVLTASARVVAYAHFTDFGKWSKKRVEGTASTNLEVLRPQPQADRAPASTAKVEVALLRPEKGLDPLAKAKCEWLTKRGKFKGVKPDVYGACDEPTWLKAKLGKTKRGKAPFTFEFKHELAPGKYIAYSRATNEAGVAEPTFTKKIGNRQPFKVKR